MGRRQPHIDAPRFEVSGPLFIGFDPAWMGTDSSAMAWRQGRQVLRVERRSKLDTVESAGWLKQVIDRDKPTKVFLDVGGVGAGVYDRLCEMGYDDTVTAVNFGSKPLEPPPLEGGGSLDRRAEMWMKSREWLEEEAAVCVPDDDALQADACGPSYKYDSNTRLLIEKTAPLPIICRSLHGLTGAGHTSRPASCGRSARRWRRRSSKRSAEQASCRWRLRCRRAPFLGASPGDGEAQCRMGRAPAAVRDRDISPPGRRGSSQREWSEALA